jgi:hypothetical protein
MQHCAAVGCIYAVSSKQGKPSMLVDRSVVTALYCLASLGVAGTTASAAQPDASITVTAPRLTDEQAATAARAYAEQVLPTPVYGQFARWLAPVCIKVSGIDPAYGPRIARRIEAAAAAAGVKRALAGCKPNLLVVFTPDARKTVDVITARKPRTLARLTDEERWAVQESPLPVRWWYTIEPTDRNGVAATSYSGALMAAQSGGAAPLSNMLPINPDTVMTDNWSSSVIDTNLIASVTGAVAVVDVPLATGTDLDALSDYLALVTLAPTRLPPRSPGVPSILDLFGTDSAGTPPATLSEWDTAFMAGLYKSVASRRANWQRGQIVEHLKTASEP